MLIISLSGLEQTVTDIQCGIPSFDRIKCLLAFVYFGFIFNDWVLSRLKVELLVVNPFVEVLVTEKLYFRLEISVFSIIECLLILMNYADVGVVCPLIIHSL